MARAATTTDVFNAVAEPSRREIIGLLSDGKEWAVNDVVVRLRLAQPAVSKHLGVLRSVGLVAVVKQGQHRMYRLEAAMTKYVGAAEFKAKCLKLIEEMQTEQEKPRLKSLSPGYLETMGVPLLGGRYLDESDSAGPINVIVNRTVAKRYFGDVNPIGQTLIWRTGQALNSSLQPFDAPLEIVGVVEDIRQGRVATPAYAEIFMDYRQVRAVHERMKFAKGRIDPYHRNIDQVRSPALRIRFRL